MNKAWLKWKRDDWSREGIRNLVVHIYGGMCAWCGTNEKLELDHIIPLYRLGDNGPGNIQLLCNQCHREKTKIDRFKFTEKKSKQPAHEIYLEELDNWLQGRGDRPKVPLYLLKKKTHSALKTV